MTKEEFETALAELLQAKRANVQESKDLDEKLIALRRAYENPTLEEMISEETSQGSAKRD